MRTRTQALLVVAALLGSSSVSARAQDTAIDPRWLAYLGCWERVDAAKSHVCVVPAGDRSSVDLVTVEKGEVIARERIAVTGERLQTIRGDCAVWHSAQWSSHGQRLYLRSEDTCAGGTATGTGVIAMSDNGHWLYIQAMTIGGQTGLRVQRYREATSEVLLPDDVAAAVRLGISSTLQARAAAGAPLSIDDVVEASRNVDGAVIEAWLVERGDRFTLDAKRLTTLADAHVSARVIDLMVALLGRPESVTAYKAELPPLPLREPVNQTSSPSLDHASPCNDFQSDESVVFFPLRSTMDTEPPVSPSCG